MSKSFLIVNDEPVSRMLLKKMLESRGYTSEPAADGAEAVALFEPGKYGAIFMNIQMPVMNGHEAARKIREKEFASNMRVFIVACTADVMPSARNLAFESGMDSFLSEPFRHSDVDAQLAMIFNENA